PGCEGGGWSLWGQLAVCVHEHQHVEQLDREGWFKFAGKYLLSSAGRAAFEVLPRTLDDGIAGRLDDVHRGLSGVVHRRG
ncbi:MAG TPA: hypothetical protein P5305_20395, partial [Rubrivivax sp.]|nr:hypothetical protein [Rubrivivax sp.]